MSYITKLKRLINAKKITQEELAKDIGKNKHTITNYLKGNTKIDVETLLKIASALDVPVSYFFEETSGNKNFLNRDGTQIVGNKNNNVLKQGNNTGNDLEVCRKELEYLKQQIKDKEEIISLLKSK